MDGVLFLFEVLKESPLHMSAASSPSALNIPAVPGKYRPIFELGRGGMADVVLAVIQGPGGFNKLQVLKRLRSELAADPEFLTMFLDEARLSARINHPNVVQTNEVGHDGKHYFLAMEYLEGQSLESFLRRAATRGNGLPLAMCLQITVDALGGLHHAHELADFDGTPLNVVHRDISPQNIFVTYDGQTKILDFGIAKASDSSSETRAGVVKGKVAYMAPEQLRGGKGVDRRADIFSVGAVLWRALTGRRLWKGLSDIEIFQNLARGEIPSPTTVTPDAPPRLVEICMKALAVRPSERYSSALDLQADLENYIAASPEKATQREIGKLLTELFADHRVEVKNAVESRLRVAAQPTRESGEIPVLYGNNEAVDPRMTMSSASNSMSSGSIGAAGDPVASPAPAEPSIRVSAPVARPGGLSASTKGLLIGLVVGVIGVGALLVITSKTHAGGTVPTASVSAAPPVREMTDLWVEVTPQNARVFVDDDPITQTPPQGRFQRDSAKHWVRAEAPGYLTKAVLVPFDKNAQTVQLTLDREHTVTPPGGGGKKPR
jgi:serine/threonine-protein kinase